MYFPETYPVNWAEDLYKNYIETENILGGNYKEKSPHQYQTDEFYIKEGDILLDIGSAEALVALDVIEKVKKYTCLSRIPNG